ncbi:hypothetical protein V5O48_006634 [Marasmius crinis-equi]|uniref:Transmembrane protein n=1 Tax=Marasmius crinis-equi TaxID=585013 RepID=A0ABR3FIX8_9AGAR
MVPERLKVLNIDPDSIARLPSVSDIRPHIRDNHRYPDLCFGPDGRCIIGLKLFASIPLLAFDVYITVLLNSLFLWPLFRVGFIASPELRKVAIRTLGCSIVALATSTINVSVLTIMHGKQSGWVCLNSCSADVIINTLAMYWVTERRGASSDSDSESPPHDPTVPTVLSGFFVVSRPSNDTHWCQTSPSHPVILTEDISTRSQADVKEVKLVSDIGVSPPPTVHMQCQGGVEQLQGLPLSAEHMRKLYGSE